MFLTAAILRTCKHNAHSLQNCFKLPLRAVCKCAKQNHTNTVISIKHSHNHVWVYEALVETVFLGTTAAASSAAWHYY